MSTTSQVDNRPYTTVFTLSRESMDVLSACSAHCDELAAHYGRTSTQYLEAVASWHRNVTLIFAAPMGGDVSISRDGDRSLLVVSRGSGFTYGVIWHGTKRRCTRTGCQAYINDDGSVWTYSRDAHQCDDDLHVASYPIDAPQPGTWSFHS